MSTDHTPAATVGARTRYCPSCNADWQAAPIPEEHREHYGSATHYSRLIGVYDRRRDRTVAWQCPDCKREWER